MKANNLTICIPPTKGLRECNKNCPYCISKITWCPKPNVSLMRSNVYKVLKLTELEGIHNILITSKGEPLLNMGMLDWVLRKFKDYRLELQTNGIQLYKTINFDSYLNWENYFIFNNLNTLALSIDTKEQITNFSKIADSYRIKGINIRICFNITKMFDKVSFDQFMILAKIAGASQVLFRNITYPSTADCKEVQWIKNNTGNYKEIFDYVINLELPVVRYIEGLGNTVFDYKGIAVMFSDYCIEEKADEKNGARSLIFHQDGHVYTSWNTSASILF